MINRLCLALSSYECFGLLGENGAGKSTTLKMMTNEILISYGNAWVAGMNLKKNPRKVNKKIGYCPQNNCLLEQLTGRRTLQIFCMIHGISWSCSQSMAEKLAQELDFTEYLDKKVKTYSGGNKRKLSAAIALAGDPLVLYLDEPTAGMKSIKIIYRLLR